MCRCRERHLRQRGPFHIPRPPPFKKSQDGLCPQPSALLAPQPCCPILDDTLANCFIFHCDSVLPSSDAASFSWLAAAWPKLERVGVGFLGFMRRTALSAGSAVITQS